MGAMKLFLSLSVLVPVLALLSFGSVNDIVFGAFMAAVAASGALVFTMTSPSRFSR